MFFQRWRGLLFLITLFASTLSCSDTDNTDLDLRVVQQTDALRAQLGQSVKGSFTLVNPSSDSMRFTVESHAPESLLLPAIKNGTIAPKSAQKIAVTATCPMQDGQFLMKLTIINDLPGSQPTDVFLRLQCGWVAADPETIGNLLVNIENLPEHLNANISVEGPDNFQAIIDTTTTLRGLTIGRYVLTAEPVSDDETTYIPAPLLFILTVTNDDKARADFTYSVQPELNDD